MKAKNLLAMLAAATMLATAALPAYAEDEPLPAAPAAEEQTQEFDEQQNPVTVLEATQNDDNMDQPVMEIDYKVSIGNVQFDVPSSGSLYLIAENGTVKSASAENYNVEVALEDDCIHVTLHNVNFVDTKDYGYSSISSNQKLHITLVGENKGEGTAFSNETLTIDGDGSLAITMKRDTRWYAGFGGASGLTVKGNARLYFDNQYSGKSTSGMYSANHVNIEDNANITLKGNLENGIYAPNVPVQMDGGTIEIDGAKTAFGGGIYASCVIVNDGTLTIKNTRGNGIYTSGNVTLNGGTVTISNTDHFNPDDSTGKGISAGSGKVIVQNGATLVCDDNECNDVFGLNGIVVDGATVNLTNGDNGLVVFQGDIEVKNSNITTENHTGNVLSIYQGNIKVEGTTGEVKITKTGAEALHTVNGNIELNGNVTVIDAGRVPTSVQAGYDAVATGSGDITVTGGKINIVNASGNGIEAGASGNGTGNVSIENGEVKIESHGSALAAVEGTVSISGAAKVEGTSEASGIYSGNAIKVTGNDCDITLSGAYGSVSRAITFENADELVKLGGADAASAKPVTPEEMHDCNYLHIFKGKARPADSVIIKASDWTEGETPILPTATDKAGTDLNAKVYYKVKGADDATYTDVVPTAVGEYEVKLVVPASGEYLESVYYASFAITAKQTQPTQPTPTPTPAQSNSSNSSTTTKATATPKPTAAPRAEGKAQSTPAAVTAAIPQTADTFPYAGLAALMGTAALGMAGVLLLRKKRQ